MFRSEREGVTLWNPHIQEQKHFILFVFRLRPQWPLGAMWMRRGVKSTNQLKILVLKKSKRNVGGVDSFFVGNGGILFGRWWYTPPK